MLYGFLAVNDILFVKLCVCIYIYICVCVYVYMYVMYVVDICCCSVPIMSYHCAICVCQAHRLCLCRIFCAGVESIAAEHAMDALCLIRHGLERLGVCVFFMLLRDSFSNCLKIETFNEYMLLYVFKK